MVRRSLLSLLGSLLVVGVLSGCASSPDASSPDASSPDGSPGRLKSALGPDRIRVGDPITVNFTDIPDPQTYQFLVREDGTIRLPLGVVVKAAGKNKAELEEEIHQEFVPRYYVRLKVAIETGERMIYVGGAVRVPNRYPYAGDMTVLKAIKVAGDFNEFANRKKVIITREDGTKITVDCKKAERDDSLDLPVYPGDKIEVKKKSW